jgi:hypothetical protein
MSRPIVLALLAPALLLAACAAGTAPVGGFETGAETKGAAAADAGAPDPSDPGDPWGDDPTDPGDPGPGGGKGDGGKGGKGKPDGGKSDGGTNACASRTNAIACLDCCSTASPGGADIRAQAFLDCSCAGPCQTACANSACAGTAPTSGDACDTCLLGATTCGPTADTACKAIPACAAFLTCVAQSSCDTKP